MINKRSFLIMTCLILAVFSFSKVDAATLYVVPESKSVEVGEVVEMNIRISTDGVGINAAQAEVRFPTNILEVVETDKKGTVFNFWAEEPTVFKDAGTIHFIGGTAKGVSGASLQVLKIKFKAIDSGLAEIVMTDAVVAASDGKGTNVLDNIKGGYIAVAGDGVVVELPADLNGALPTGSVEVVEVREPEKIEREAVISKELPAVPEIRIPLYSDETRWYNHLGELVVFWELPPDVTQVSTRLSRIKDNEQGVKETELFNGKNLGLLDEEGIWYVRVNFKNNVGWSKPVYYKISIDTTAPLPFDIEMDALISDNPSPEIRFDTQDEFSGISHALVVVDSGDPIKSTSTSFILPLQKPGEHRVLIRFFDFAGNSVEDYLEFEVLPLPTPVVSFVPEHIAQDEVLYILGKSIPSGFVDVKILDKKDMEVYSVSVETDIMGGWETTITEPLSIGSYFMVATARDYRGAVSYSTDKILIKIKARVILSLGFVDLGWFEIFFFVVLVFVIAGGGTFWLYFMEQKKKEAYEIIASRDVDKMGNLLLGDLAKMKETIRQMPEDTGSKIGVELGHYHDRMKSTVTKMKKYIGREASK